MDYDSEPFIPRTAEIPVTMRIAVFHLCLLSLSLLAACGSSPKNAAADNAGASNTRVTVTMARGDGEGSTVQSHTTSSFIRVSASKPVPAYHASRVSGDYAGYSSVERFIDRMVREEGFDPEYLAGVLSRADRKQWIIDFVTRPKRKGPTVPTGYWTRYRAKFLTKDNIAGGSRFWHRYEAILNRAYAKYGVPPEYIVAIIGVETRYGAYMGKHRVADALATLAFDFPRRSEFFTDELAAFLVMARDEGFDPFEPVGSYAGAMGYGQFMPSSFHQWAVDFDGDGRRDLWNPVDAIGSVANYFASHGWRTGEAVAVRARADGSGAKAMKTGFDTSYSLNALQSQGVSPRGRVRGEEDVSLIRLDARGGYQYWLGLSNFYVITRYNHSSNYAMAVHQLAQSVRSRNGVGTGTRLSQLETGS